MRNTRKSAMENSGFTVREIGVRPCAAQKPSKNKRRLKAHTTKRGVRFKRPGAMMVKIGICAAACAVVFLMKWIEAPIADQMVSGVKSAVSEETDLTEMLGKLQFVEFPNIIEVFSENESMILPICAPVLNISEDMNYAEWEGAPNAEVLSSAAGKVRSIGEDAILGRYVRIMHEKDVETVYYGFSIVQVEEGQPVRRQDTLGKLGDEGVLRLLVFEGGEPRSPKEYLNIA